MLLGQLVHKLAVLALTPIPGEAPAPNHPSSFPPGNPSQKGLNTRSEIRKGEDDKEGDCAGCRYFPEVADRPSDLVEIVKVLHRRSVRAGMFASRLAHHSEV